MGAEYPTQELIRSDGTLFSIIEHLMEEDGASITEMANELGMAKSGVHKHLKTMEKHEYAVKRDGKYRLGLQFFHRGVYTHTQYDIP